MLAAFLRCLAADLRLSHYLQPVGPRSTLFQLEHICGRYIPSRLDNLWLVVQGSTWEAKVERGELDVSSWSDELDSERVLQREVSGPMITLQLQ
jgi:hypothetical protein